MRSTTRRPPLVCSPTIASSSPRARSFHPPRCLPSSPLAGLTTSQPTSPPFSSHTPPVKYNPTLTPSSPPNSRFPLPSHPTCHATARNTFRGVGPVVGLQRGTFVVVPSRQSNRTGQARRSVSFISQAVQSATELSNSLPSGVGWEGLKVLGMAAAVASGSFAWWQTRKAWYATCYSCAYYCFI